ncbi:hypothetical protein B9Z55_019909 [Caenorhabditis nigoni]|uniref:Serpentine receptor class gamma n=1 Tax=Caenorhabditis nigoni TaxID=1611254 RepID=A0A2G5TKG9_9PELO|nr:hypothetical protein B9Z55_019909 [Caenorhabditis nigoni]
MLKCHPGFSAKLEILKYGIQVIYFLLGLFFHFALLKVLTRKRAVYSKFAFLKLYYVDSVLIQKCIIPHVVIFSILTPSIGVWTVFLSDSQFVPFQGGFTPETKMSFNWITVSQFSAIISSITIGVVVTCSLISMICMSRTRSENKHTQQSLTASALCQSIFYVLVLSMEIYFNKSKPSSIETAEFWKALTAFSFDILLVLPPIIMLCLNVRLRVDVFARDSGNPLNSPK